MGGCLILEVRIIVTCWADKCRACLGVWFSNIALEWQLLISLLQPGQCIERIGYELLTNPFAAYALLCYAKVNTLQSDAPQADWWF